MRLLFQPDDLDQEWKSREVPYPSDRFGPHPTEPVGPSGTKAVNIVDLNQDGQLDMVNTCEGAIDGRSGVLWLEGPDWTPHDISGPDGIIFDRIEIFDIDTDGDEDVLTCEEATVVAGKR